MIKWVCRGGWAACGNESTGPATLPSPARRMRVVKLLWLLVLLKWLALLLLVLLVSAVGLTARRLPAAWLRRLLLPLAVLLVAGLRWCVALPVLLLLLLLPRWRPLPASGLLLLVLLPAPLSRRPLPLPLLPLVLPLLLLLLRPLPLLLLPGLPLLFLLPQLLLARRRCFRRRLGAVVLLQLFWQQPAQPSGFHDIEALALRQAGAEHDLQLAQRWRQRAAAAAATTGGAARACSRCRCRSSRAGGAIEEGGGGSRAAAAGEEEPCVDAIGPGQAQGRHHLSPQRHQPHAASVPRVLHCSCPRSRCWCG